MKILYRISDGGYKKEKLDFATKMYCLDNAIKVFGINNIILFADNCKNETIEEIKKTGIVPTVTNKGSSGQSWKMVAEYAILNLCDDEIIYFLEDDYLHKDCSQKAILEALNISDYVSLYDHPDKYLDPQKGGNRFVSNGGELGRVLLTESSHWKTTTSTTMTFACKLKTLKEDWQVWDYFTLGSHPSDDMVFYKLMGKRKFSYWYWALKRGFKRKLITPIPGLSTHVESAWLSPLINWWKI